LLRRAALAILLGGLVAWACTEGLPSGQAQDGHQRKGHGPARVPEGLKYPRGDQIKQVYLKPESTEFAAGPGVGVATEQVMAFAGAQPTLKQRDLELRPRYVTRLSAEEEPEAEAEPPAGTAPGAAEALEAAGQERLAHYEFDVLYKGRPVTKGSHSVVVANRKAILARDRNLPAQGADLGPTDNTIKYEAARDLAQRDARELFAKLYPNAEPILAVVTLQPDAPRLEILLDAERKKGTLAWRFSVMSTDPGRPMLRRYWVAARDDAKILNHEDRIFYARDRRTRARTPLLNPNLLPEPDLRRGAVARPPADLVARLDEQPVVTGALVGTHGRVTGTAWKTSPFSGIHSVPLAGIEVTVIKHGIPHVTRTNRYGRYMLPGVVGQVTVRATLAGPFCTIVNDGGGTVLSVSKQGHGEINLAFEAQANEEFKLSQITAFYAVNKVHDFAKAYLPQTPVKLARTPTHVNLNQTCNAFWDPGAHTINFFRSTPNSCPNTAYTDVAFHEYGHGIDDELGGILDGGYSEGFGDSMAVLITRQSIIGRDFFGPPMGTTHQNLRDASEVHKWPDVQGSFDPHEVGEAYNGFTWELTRQLLTKYGNHEGRAFAVAKKLILGAAANNPNDIPDAVRWSFFVDAHIYPGPTGQPSRHYDALVAAAKSRDLPYPANPAAIFAE
jgi:hypothetical protein